ncbi:MAG: hypothetical protein IKU00_08250 [Bacteroidales bacterium]|nr:hypothetical protein [Bacteroidales bacterium]
MAVVHGMNNTNSVKVFHDNIEEIQDKVNQWLQVNDKYVDVVDIKLSECQNKTIVLIHYKKKETN